MIEATRGSSIARRRRSTSLLLPLLRLGTPSRGQLSARESAQPDNSNFESALARIEKLEAENRKLRESLKDGDRVSSAEPLSTSAPTSTSTSSSSSKPAAPPAAAKPAAAPAAAPAAVSAAAPAAGSAAAPLPTSLQFQAVEEPVAASGSSSSSSSSSSTSLDVSNVAWPSPGEPFWERSPIKTKGMTKASAAAAAAAAASSAYTSDPSSPPASPPTKENNVIFHVAAELAPRAKVGGLGDVVAGLARECASRGRRAVVVLPFYECLPEDAIENLELADEFACPKGNKIGDGGKIASFEQLGVSAFSGRLDGIDVLLLRPDWNKTNLFRGGRIYGGSYNETEAYVSLFFLEGVLQKGGERPRKRRERKRRKRAPLRPL